MIPTIREVKNVVFELFSFCRRIGYKRGIRSFVETHRKSIDCGLNGFFESIPMTENNLKFDHGYATNSVSGHCSPLGIFNKRMF